jgi:cholesterol transport system auxiliary component
MRSFRLWLRTLALGLVAAGCSLIPARPPPAALHDFGPPPAREASLPWAAVTVDAPDWLNDDHIHYRFLYADPTQLRSYATVRWVAPLPALLTQRLTSADGHGRYRLRIQLQEFEQVFDRPGHARVVISFRANAQVTAGNQELAEKVFRLSIATSSADATGAVEGFAAVVDRAITALRDWYCLGSI